MASSSKVTLGSLGLNYSSLDSALQALVKKQFPAFLKLEFGADVAPVHLEWWSYLQQKNDCIFLAPRDHGKLCGHSQEVLTFNRGWTTHGELEVGDFVYGVDGNPTKVLALSEEGKASLEVTISDGSRVQVHPNHEWEVEDRRQKGKKRVRVVETKTLLEEGLFTGVVDVRPRFNLPAVGEIEFSRKDLEIPPYILGLWLGDGVHSKATIAQSEKDKGVFLEVDKAYEATSEWVHKDTGVVYRNYQGMWKCLKYLGLVKNKHIPEKYLNGSIEQRKQLLAGLIDSDGCVEERKGHQRVRFVNCNLKLIEGVEEICRSFNWNYSRSEQEPALSTSGVQGRQKVYTVRITPGSELPNKLERKKVTGDRSKGFVRRSIVGIREIQEVKGRCIQVEDPRGLYLVGRSLIPTHNSHVLSRAYSIWNLKYNDFVEECLILGSDTPSAIDNMDKLKAIMLANPNFSHLVPTDRKHFNTRAEMKLTNGKTLKAKGFFSPLRGRHPQLIICDDILNEKNSSSESQRAKTRRYFFEVVYPMRDKGSRAKRALGYKPQIVMVGTAQDREDLYHELMSNPAFMGILQSAIVNNDTKEVLWPERYSYDDLMKIKDTIGSLSFAKEYCNEPIMDETSMFPPGLFKPMFDYDLSYVTEYSGSNPIFSGTDFSIPGDNQGDFTVHVVGEKTTGGAIKMLSIWRAQPATMKEQVERIEIASANFGLTLGYVEANMFQKIYAEYFKNYTSLPIKGNVVTASGKNSYSAGVLSFRPLFENQKFIFPYKTPYDREITDMVVREFSGLVRKDGKLGNFRFHDDIVMALWHMLCASRQTRFDFSF